MYKMIAIDIDGTLLNPDGKITDENKLALKRASEKDVKIVLMTGRPKVAIAQFLNQLDIGDSANYAASYNGARIDNFKTGEQLLENYLTKVDLEKLYDLSQTLDSQMHFLANDQVYTPNEAISKYTVYEAYTNDILLNYTKIDKVDVDTHIPKVMFVAEPEQINEIIKNVPQAIYDDYNLVQSAPFFLEILHKRADKRTALECMAAHFGLDLSEVAAIGDGGNDVGMIERAGLGIAMGNSMDGVKEKADVTTLSNKESGLAYAIDKWVLG